MRRRSMACARIVLLNLVGGLVWNRIKGVKIAVVERGSRLWGWRQVDPVHAHVRNVSCCVLLPLGCVSAIALPLPSLVSSLIALDWEELGCLVKPPGWERSKRIAGMGREIVSFYNLFLAVSCQFPRA